MTCSELLLRDFIPLVCGNNPKPDWWESFMSEYAELKGDTRSKSLLLLQKEINVIEEDLFLIEKIVNQINIYWDERLCDILRGDPFYYDFEYANDDNLQNELQLTINIARNKLAEKNELMHELDEMSDKEDNKPLTEMDFMVQIQSFANWQGFDIPIETTSVKKYLAIQKLFTLQNKAA